MVLVEMVEMVELEEQAPRGVLVEAEVGVLAAPLVAVQFV